MGAQLAAAWFGRSVGTGLVDVTDDITALDSSGRWAVVISFEGDVLCARFTDWRSGDPAALAGAWQGPAATAYSTSLSEGDYRQAVDRVRESIARGDVYQANICRVMSAPLPYPDRADVFALAALLARGNPAPFAGCLRLPDQDMHIATASPELFLKRDAAMIESGPIKGTATTADGLADKDVAENIMIVDLVRNDLGRVCEVGTVSVPSLLRLEDHPGVVHLVSSVRGELAQGTGWDQLLSATFPPGSVTGAPKSSALRTIAELEPVPRGPYCGAIGWVDADSKTAELAVGIRSFWLTDLGGAAPSLHFGTGAGITWGSDPQAEWEETCLKASNLIAVAAGEWH